MSTLEEKLLQELAGEKTVDKPPHIRLSNLSDEALSEHKEYPMLKTGIEQLDAGGVPTGMNLIIGQSGAGKSWFMNHLVRAAYELNGERSVIFSLEMDSAGLTRRMLQSYSRLSVGDLRYGASTAAGIAVVRACDPVIVDYTQVDTDAITPESFTDAIHQYYQDGYRVFFLDHFHELPGASVNDKNQQVTETWADAMKAIRNTYEDVWLFILVQSNKEGYKKEILTKEFVSGSSALVNKCDFFLSLNRKEKPKADLILEMDKPKSIVFWVDKNRRSFADRYSANCLLDNTGNFADVATLITEEVTDEKEEGWWD